jgi:hypothetical protein
LKTEQEAIDALINGLEILAGDLGAMLGVNQEAYDRIREALRFLSTAWRGRDLIPRRVMAELWGSTTIMLGVSERYGPLEGPKIADRAAELEELIMDCFQDPP